MCQKAHIHLRFKIKAGLCVYSNITLAFHYPAPSFFFEWMKRGEKRWPDKQMWREKTPWQWIKVHLREYINAVLGQMEDSHCPLCQVKCVNILKSCILLLRNFNANRCNRCFWVYGELHSRKNVTEFNSYILLCFLFPHGPKDKIKRCTSMHSFFFFSSQGPLLWAICHSFTMQAKLKFHDLWPQQLSLNHLRGRLTTARFGQ